MLKREATDDSVVWGSLEGQLGYGGSLNWWLRGDSWVLTFYFIQFEQPYVYL